MVPGQPRRVGRCDGEPVRSFGGAHRVEPPRTGPGELRKLLGRKVSLRYKLSDEPGFSSSELVGVLMSVDANGHITVMDRRGNAREVTIASIEAFKVFPS